MHKRMVFGLAFLLAVAFFPTQTTADISTEVVPWDSTGGAEPEHDLTCSGSAPVLNYCTTGPHQRVGGLTHGFQTPYPTEGTLESRVIFDGGARVFRCNFANGFLTSCAGSGSFPPANAYFVHDCWSYETGTGGSLGTPMAPGVPSGNPGGLGDWTCRAVNHG